MEQRACWQEGDAKPEDAPVRAGTGNGMQADRKSARQRPGTPYVPGDIDRPPVRDFIPIEDVGGAPLEAVARLRIPSSGAWPVVPSSVVPIGAAPFVTGTTAPAFVAGDPADGWEGRTNLFGDLER